MSDAAIDAYLDAIRKLGAVERMQPCALVSDQFRPIPPHQVGVVHLIARRNFLLGDYTGVGKTPQTLVAWAYLRERNPQMRLIVLAGQSALFQWRDQVKRFLPSITVETLGWSAGQKSKALGKQGRMAQYQRFTSGETAVLVGTYHTLALDWRIKGDKDIDIPDRWPFPAEWSPFVVAFDECHILRTDTQTLLYPAMKSLATQAHTVWGLSATPLSNKVMDLYHLFSVIAPGVLGRQRDFEERYLQRKLQDIWTRGKSGKPQKRKVWKITGAKNLPMLAQAMRPYYMRRPPEVIGEHIPGTVVLTDVRPMGKEQTALYEDLTEKLYPKVQAVESTTAARRADVEAQLAAEHNINVAEILHTPVVSTLAAMTYMQLAVDAPAVLGLPKIPSVKIETLIERLTTDLREDKVLVYTRYKQVAQVIDAALRKEGIASAVITGDLSAPRRREVQLAFQETSEPRCLIVTSAGRESLDLQAARVVVFFDLPWSWSEFVQVVGRARRIGSAHAHVVLLLLGATTTNNHATIDTTTLDTLKRKAILVEGTFGLTLAEQALTAVEFNTDTGTAVAAAGVPDALTDDIFGALVGESASAPTCVE